MPSTSQSLAIVLTCIVVGVAAAETPAPKAAAPAARAAQSLLPSAAGAWLLVLDTWGGFTGHGKGGVTIASDGKVFAHRLGRRANKDCRTRLTEVELQALTQAVTAALPSAWSARYEPAKEKACCDRFTWSLRLHQRAADGAERIARTGWHDASEGRPQSLFAVATIAQDVMRSVLASCKT